MEEDTTPAYRAGRLEALEQAVGVIALQLPEFAMRVVAEHLRRIAREAEDEARRRATDPLRDRAAGIHDYVGRLVDDMEQQADEVRSGARYFTIQPAPPPDEQDARHGL